MTAFLRKYNEVISGNFEPHKVAFQFFDANENVDIFLYGNGEVTSYDRNTGMSKILLEDEIDEVKNLPDIHLMTFYQKRV